MENLDKLVYELCKISNESYYVEFKHENYKPDMIGEDISALANSAALHDRDYAYMIWGIEDKTHNIVGTTKNFQNLTVGNQELENWLRCLLSPHVYFEFNSVVLNEKNISVLIIHRPLVQPVTFKKVSYIRVGSYTKKLVEYPSLEAELWDKLRNLKFEDQLILEGITLAEVAQKLDISLYFDNLGIQMPTNTENFVHYLLEDGVLKKQDNGFYAITSMGAMLFAKRILDFPRLSRKAVRLIKYTDNDRVSIEREETIQQGYVAGLKELIKYLDVLLPAKEEIQGLIRNEIKPYPPIAVREVIANALIHQDFSLAGAGVTVEVFKNRLEVTNPGLPLVDIERIIDNPPKSRNEKLAALMRRMKMCEELGSGWDKIVVYCEMYNLPAPRIETYQSSTKVTLFSKLLFNQMSMDDKILACYLHACIKYVKKEQLTNTSLRERFKLSSSAAAVVSRLIKETLKRNLIKPFDPTTAPKYMSYVPYWA